MANSTSTRLQGRVKKWFAGKGFGFIARNGERDIFVHVSALSADLRRLADGGQLEGTEVTFRVNQNPKGPEASDVLTLDEQKGREERRSAFEATLPERAAQVDVGKPREELRLLWRADLVRLGEGLEILNLDGETIVVHRIEEEVWELRQRQDFLAEIPRLGPELIAPEEEFRAKRIVRDGPCLKSPTRINFLHGDNKGWVGVVRLTGDLFAFHTVLQLVVEVRKPIDRAHGRDLIYDFRTEPWRLGSEEEILSEWAKGAARGSMAREV